MPLVSPHLPIGIFEIILSFVLLVFNKQISHLLELLFQVTYSILILYHYKICPGMSLKVIAIGFHYIDPTPPGAKNLLQIIKSYFKLWSVYFKSYTVYFNFTPIYFKLYPIYFTWIWLIFPFGAISFVFAIFFTNVEVTWSNLKKIPLSNINSWFYRRFIFHI